MARYTGPKGKLVRRFNANIIETTKMERLLARRSYPPGQHGPTQGRRKLSEYARQLNEKQKLKNTYGLLEKQFHRTFIRARQRKGVTGDNLLSLLETRLDNLIFRGGFCSTRMQARQMINHGHFLVNNRRMDIPSYQVQVGDQITVKKRDRSQSLVARCLEENPRFGKETWFRVDRQRLDLELIRRPQRAEICTEVDENLIVELYSK